MAKRADSKEISRIYENTHQIHFGKQSLTECALRHPPCQSELAELREPAIHPEGNVIHGLVEGPVSHETGGPVLRVSFAGERKHHSARPDGMAGLLR